MLPIWILSLSDRLPALIGMCTETRCKTVALTTLPNMVCDYWNQVCLRRGWLQWGVHLRKGGNGKTCSVQYMAPLPSGILCYKILCYKILFSSNTPYKAYKNHPLLKKIPYMFSTYWSACKSYTQVRSSE